VNPVPNYRIISHRSLPPQIGVNAKFDPIGLARYRSFSVKVEADFPAAIEYPEGNWGKLAPTEVYQNAALRRLDVALDVDGWRTSSK
jgi:hypothetical protein